MKERLEPEYFTIEQRRITGAPGAFAYRFRSLFNGTIGQWYSNIGAAVKDGEEHKKLIKMLMLSNMEN